jgi:hypothetical protein
MNENLLKGEDQFSIDFDEDYELKSPNKTLPPGNYEAIIREASIVPKKNDPNGRNLILDMMISAPDGFTGTKVRDYLPIPIGKYATKDDAQRASFKIRAMTASMFSESMETIKQQGKVNLTPKFLMGKKLYIMTVNQPGQNGGMFNSVKNYIPAETFEMNPGPDKNQGEDSANTDMVTIVSSSTTASDNPTVALQDLLPKDP